MLELTHEVTRDIIKLAEPLRNLNLVGTEDVAYGVMATDAALNAMRAGYGRSSIVERLRAFVAADAEHHGVTEALDEPAALIAAIRTRKVDAGRPEVRDGIFNTPQLNRDNWDGLAKHAKAMWCVVELAIWSDAPEESLGDGFTGEVGVQASFIAFALGPAAAEDMIAALRLLVEEAKQ
jgi:hypothetical protein